MDEPRYDYEVLMHLLPAVVNSDMTGLTDKEEEQLQEFCDEHGHHWYPVYQEEYPDDLEQCMGKCDVTGLIGWCVQIQVG
jgi:hypothetical protein